MDLQLGSLKMEREIDVKAEHFLVHFIIIPNNAQMKLLNN